MTARVHGHLVIRMPGSEHFMLMDVAVPPGALEALSERFCPRCLVPLTGSMPNLCPACRTVWNVHRGGP